MSNQTRKTQLVVTAASVLVLSLCFTAAARGQGESQDGPLTAPPPLKFVPHEDRAQLDAERDVKKRVQLSIKLAEAHLARAEQLTNEENYEQVTAELGMYQGLVDDALKFLATLPSKRDKTRDNNKRLELALRPHVGRLETMRRATPSAYAGNFKTMIEYVRSARDQALNSFYDDTVLRGADPLPESKESEASRRATGNSDNARTAKEKPDEQL